MAVTEPLVVTPFVGAVIPSGGYEFLGHTAIDRQVSELRTGVNLGRRLDPVLPDAYAHARYTFSLRERVLGFRFNYSYVDLERRSVWMTRTGHTLPGSDPTLGLRSAR